LSALLALRSRLAAPDENAPLAIGGGPEGDQYFLANALIELVLVGLGWRVVNIGANTPAPSFRQAMRDRRPRLLWLSCSYLPDEEEFLASYGPLYEEALSLGVAVAVGGRALTEALRDRMTFTHHGDRLAHLEAFANELWARPRHTGPVEA
jgi:methanogenic corrinoid protein MtbC1